MAKLPEHQNRRRQQLRRAYKAREAELDNAIRGAVEVALEKAPTWDKHKYDGILGVPNGGARLRREFTEIRARLLYPCAACGVTHSPDDVRVWIDESRGLASSSGAGRAGQLWHQGDVRRLAEIQDSADAERSQRRKGGKAKAASAAARNAERDVAIRKKATDLRDSGMSPRDIPTKIETLLAQGVIKLASGETCPTLSRKVIKKLIQ